MNNDMMAGMVIAFSVWGVKWLLDKLFAADLVEAKAEAKPETEEMVPWWAVAIQGTELHGNGKALGVVTTRAKTQDEAEAKACIVAAMDGFIVKYATAARIGKAKRRVLPEAPAGDRS